MPERKKVNMMKKVGQKVGKFFGTYDDPTQNPYRDEWSERLGGEIEGARGRRTYINTGPQQQFRGAQLDLMEQLRRQAMGEGPSLAGEQLRAGMDRNLNQAMAMAGTMGGNPALALRNIGTQRADMGQQVARDAAMARMAEQQSAQQQLGGLIGQGRGQDIGLATSQANVRLQQQALNDALVRAFTQMGFDMDMAQFMANERQQQMNQQGKQRLVGAGLGAVGDVLSVFG